MRRRRRRRRCRRSRRRRRRFFAVAPCALLLSPWTSSPCCLRVGVVALLSPWMLPLARGYRPRCCRPGRRRPVAAVDVVALSSPWTLSVGRGPRPCCFVAVLDTSCPRRVVALLLLSLLLLSSWTFRVCGCFVCVDVSSMFGGGYVCVLCC